MIMYIEYSDLATFLDSDFSDGPRLVQNTLVVDMISVVGSLPVGWCTCVIQRLPSSVWS